MLEGSCSLNILKMCELRDMWSSRELGETRHDNTCFLKFQSFILLECRLVSLMYFFRKLILTNEYYMVVV